MNHRSQRTQLVATPLVVAVTLAIALLTAVRTNAQPAPGSEDRAFRTATLEESRALPIASPARAAEFRDRHAGAWHVSVDPMSGTLREIYGTGFELDGPVDSPIDVLAAGLEIVETERDFLGLTGTPALDAIAFDLIASGGEPVRAGALWYANFGLVRDGIPFDARSRVDLRIHESGVLAAILLGDLPTSLDPATPTTAAVSARDAVMNRARAISATDLAIVEEPRLEYVVDAAGHAHLAWKSRVEGIAANGMPLLRDVWIAARGDARFLTERDHVHTIDVTGDAIGRGNLSDPTTGLIDMPLEHLEVSVQETGNTGLTDAAGMFTVPNAGSSPVTVVAELRGPFVDVDTLDGGPDLRYEMVHTPGTPVPIRFNASPPEGVPTETAQVNAFVHTNYIHDFLRSRLDLPALDVPIPCAVNEPTTIGCNAVYQAGTLKFQDAVGNCRNMAFDTIIYHEYGHFLDDVTGGIIDRALTEGLADAIAALASGQPLIGANYDVTQQYLRTVDNDTQWPAYECGSSVHCAGGAYAGFVWHARERLINKLGEGPGTAHAEAIVLLSTLANPINMPRAVLEVFLQDDDDGNIANGSPNFTQLARAALRHGFDPPVVEIVKFTHSEWPFATVDSVNDLDIVATIEPFVGPLSSAMLYYSLDNGSYQSTSMMPGGATDEWVGTIAAQPCGTWIKYYFEATDAIGNTRLWPPLAGDSARRLAFSFHIGRAEVIFFEDFENGFGPAWTHGADSGVDDWEAGTPNPSGTNIYDPTFAYSGTGVAGTDLTMDGNYANDTSSFLRTTIDCSAYTTIWTKFRHWISTERFLSDTLRFRVENSSTTMNGQAQAIAATAWTPFERDISLFAAGNAEVDIQFLLDSDDTFTAGGWNVDDFEVQSVTCDTVTFALDKHTYSPGESVAITMNGGPDEPYYLLSDRNFGDATFQIPNGPEIATGLTNNQQLRASANLDSSGERRLRRNVPNNPALVGKHFILVLISKNTVWQRSNFFEVDIVP